MIQEFVNRFMANKGQLEARFSAKHPEDYDEIVKAVIEVITIPRKYGQPDPNQVHAVSSGSYQGVLVFVIAEYGYDPSDFWYVRVNYGSCSGCDTLERIRGYKYGPPEPQQVKDYMTLALHIVQKLKKMEGDAV